MCLNNLHVRIWRSIWSATCTKNWRNAKPLLPTARWVSNRSLTSNIIRANHSLKHTIEDKAKVSHESVNLTLMPVPCTLFNSYIVFEKKGRLVCNCSRCTVSHRLIPRCALNRSKSLHNKHTIMDIKPVLYHKSSAQSKCVKGNEEFKSRFTPKFNPVGFFFFSLMCLKTMYWMFLESKCANRYRKFCLKSI